MNRKEFFNAKAAQWDAHCRHDQGTINRILDLVNIRPGDKILDIGTGTGVLIPFLVSRVGSTGEIIGVDMAEKMIEAAQKKYACYPHVHFVVGDIFQMDLPDACFDVIMCYSVFPHFEEQASVPERLGVFLRPGGKLAVCHSMSRDQINKVHQNASSAVSGDYLPDADTIKGFYLAAGYDIVEETDNEKMFVVVGRKKDIGNYSISCTF